MLLKIRFLLIFSLLLPACIPKDDAPELMSGRPSATEIDTTSTGDAPLGSDSGKASSTDSNDTGADPDSNALGSDAEDTSPPPFWVPEGPKQLAFGSVEIECDPEVLITAEGEYWLCDPMPVPCVPDEPKVDCHIVVRGEQNEIVYDGPVGIERRGRSSMLYNKPNYGIEFRDANGDDNPVPCMRMGKEADWVLDGSWLDRSFIRNDFVQDVFSELGPKTHYGPDSRYMTLTFNGTPQGIYRLVEKIKRDDDRVNIPKDDGTGKNFIIKHDVDGTLEMWLGLERNSWSTVHPNPTKATEQQLAAISDWMQSFADALDCGDAFTMLNMDNVVDFVLMQELSKNIDGFQYSLYIFKEDGALANLVPWDFDLAFGQPAVDYAGDTPNESPEGWILHHTNLIAKLLDDATFVSRLKERWIELRSLPLSDAAVDMRIDEYLMVLNGSPISDNFAIWPMDEVSFDRNMSAYQIYSIDSFDAEIAKVRQWIHDRLVWMDNNLENYAAFSDGR